MAHEVRALTEPSASTVPTQQFQPRQDLARRPSGLPAPIAAAGCARTPMGTDELLTLRSYAFERLNTSAVVLDEDGVIVDSNEAWRLFAHLNDGAPASTGVGVNYLDVCDRASAGGSYASTAVAVGLREILSGDRFQFDFEYSCDSPTESRWFRLQASSAPVSNGTGVVVLHVDTTAGKLRELQLERQAERDPLTGLPNRLAAHRFLGTLLSDVGAGRSATVMFVDLDGFKSVNDTHGHHVGDELLAKVSSRLRHAVRVDDMVCRFGGDEFVVVCSDLDPEQTTSITDRVGTLLRQPFQIGADTISVGASVGCSISTPGCTVDSMLQSADAAMYAAKTHARSVAATSDAGPCPIPDAVPVARPGWSAAPGVGLITTGEHCRIGTRDPQTQALAVVRPRPELVHHPLTEARLSAVVHRSTDVALFFEGDGTIVWVSPASSEVFGIAAEDLVGASGFDLIHPEDLERVIQELLQGLTSPGTPVHVEFRLNDPGGELRWVEETVTDLTADPDVGFVVGNLRDVTARKASEGLLTRLALVDELTALPNRNALLAAIRTAEESPDTSLATGLVLFDLDDFCDVNDTLGHDTGDALLAAVAQRVRGVVPPDVLVARYGGDQFGVFGPLLSSVEACVAIADSVQASLSTPFEIDGHELTASATSGIALASSGCLHELIRDADAALYHAKRTTKGGSTVFRADITEGARMRLSRTNNLRLAVSRQEITPFYQPVVDLVTGQVVGVEVLARWNHAEYGWVPPDEFIPLAEATGLIEVLGQQIVTRACGDAAGWLRDGRRLQLGINASGVQLVNSAFVSMIDAALAATGLSADQLTIEITETAAIRDPAGAQKVLAALQERGILLTLDDFGTGYSPLTALRDLPVGAIKLDQSFVAELGRPAGDSLAEGILHLGFATGMFVVAEGVETQAQADQLRALGCRFGQGYLWSRAVAGSDLAAAIESIERPS